MAEEGVTAEETAVAEEVAAPKTKKARTISLPPVEQKVIGSVQYFGEVNKTDPPADDPDREWQSEFVRVPVEAGDAYLCGPYVYTASTAGTKWEDAVFKRTPLDALSVDSFDASASTVESYLKSAIGQDPKPEDPDASYFGVTFDGAPKFDVYGNEVADSGDIENIAVVVEATKERKWGTVSSPEYGTGATEAELLAQNIVLHETKKFFVTTDFGVALAGDDNILVAAAASYLPIANDGTLIHGTSLDKGRPVDAFNNECLIDPEDDTKGYTTEGQAHLIRAFLNTVAASKATPFDGTQENLYPDSNPALADLNGYVNLETGTNQSVGYAQARDARQQDEDYPFVAGQEPTKEDLYPAPKPQVYFAP